MHTLNKVTFSSRFLGVALALPSLLVPSACLELHDETSPPVVFEEVQGSEEALVPHPDCSDETKARMRAVINASRMLLDAALRDAEGGNDHALQRWFGPGLDGPPLVLYSFLNKREYVTEVLRAMRSELDSSEPLRCGGDGCSDNLGVVNHYAVRDPRIRLCSGVWSKPLFGVDSFSQAEVLVHELAHFVTDGNVTDVAHAGCAYPRYNGNGCYEYANARILADLDPLLAPMNAENFAGFAAESFVRPALIAVLSGLL